MALSNREDKTEQVSRSRLAVGLTIGCTAGIIILSIFAISNKPENAMQVLQSVLPLFGTWVATILAFFYSRENFEAANRNVNAMVKQLTSNDKLHAAKVKDNMELRNIIHAELVNKKADGTLESTNHDTDLKLCSILERLKKADKGQRIPIFDEHDHPLYVIHRSTIDRFIADKALHFKAGDKSVLELDLNDLLNDAETRKILDHGFSLIGLDADLAEAKNKMDDKANCEDVLVTKNGTADEPVLGWITNAKIREMAMV